MGGLSYYFLERNTGLGYFIWQGQLLNEITGGVKCGQRQHVTEEAKGGRLSLIFLGGLLKTEDIDDIGMSM